MPFKPGEGREPINLLESQIRYAMENSKSNNEAARFLNVSYPTYKKYASLYIDTESSLSLFDLHKNQAGKGVRKSNSGVNHGRKLEDILEGKYPEYPIHNLKRRLLRSGRMEEKCCSCGMEERRVTDYTVPLLLDHIDGDRKNHKEENLRLLCFNCYYLEVGNFTGKKKEYYGY